MTVEIEFVILRRIGLGDWQVQMAKQIESNHGFPINDIDRELSGGTFIVRVETTLPNQAVENMLWDIEEYLPSTASHVETREID